MKAPLQLTVAAAQPTPLADPKGMTGADLPLGAARVCRMHPSQMAQQRASGLTRAQSVGVPHNWGYDDDALLAALVVEYGYNWHFIADTCSSTCVLQVCI